MGNQSVRAAEASEREAVIDTLALAFSADPCVRYMWPRSDDFMRHWRGFSMGLGGRALDHGTAFVAGDACAAALWLPPGIESDEAAIGAVIEESVSAAKQAVLEKVVEGIGHFHPREAHWYLALVGVDPAHQGSGLGSMLIQHGLRRCDQQGLPAYLESSNPRNTALYERHGFEVIGVIQPGDFPPLAPMLRPARGRRP